MPRQRSSFAGSAAAERRQSPTVIREAVRQLAARELRDKEAPRPYDALTRLIGSVDSGGMALAKGTGHRLAALLAERMLWAPCSLTPAPLAH
jgi:hypothetical protein